MGNTNQSDAGEHGNAFVRTDKPYYYAGEIVTGTVYLNIYHSDYPGNIVILKIKGSESCSWSEQVSVSSTDANGQTTTTTETVYYQGKNQFYSHKINLFQFTMRTLPEGQYGFPFSFQLFGHLPGSFFDECGHIAKIQYKLKAECDPYQKNFKKIKHHQILIVHEPQKSQTVQLFGEMKVHAKTWCCVDQGHAYIKTFFEKSHYLPGEEARLAIEIDNSQCQLDVKCIKSDLISTLTLISNCGHQRRVVKNVSEIRQDGIHAGEQAMGQNTRYHNLQLVDRSNHNNPNQPLQPSTNGSVVKHQYSLRAQATLDGCTCCVTDPQVEVPISILCPPPMLYSTPPQAPQNWHPQMQDTRQIILTDNDMYTKNMTQGNSQNPLMTQM